MHALEQYLQRDKHLPHWAITGLKNDNEYAFARIYAEYYPGLLEITYILVHDMDEAKDIVAGAFIKLWDRRKSFENLRSVKGFLYTSIRQNSFDFLKYIQRLETAKVEYAFWIEFRKELYPSIVPKKNQENPNLIKTL